MTKKAKTETKAKTTAKTNPQAQATTNQIDFVIQKIFTADASFEAPNAPNIFKNEWKPEANIDLNTSNSKLEDNNHMVNLTITVTAKNQDETAFVAEVKQAGVFTIAGAEEAQMGHILNAYCPSVLFPYASELVASMVSRGGFPQLTLAPVNFDALYAQQLQQQQTAAKN